MDFANILKLAWNGLKVNKGRSFLTMLGIIIGTSAVIIIISAGAGAQSLIKNQIQSLGSNLVSVIPGSGGGNGPPAAAFGVVITTLKYEDAKALIAGPQTVPHVESVSTIVRGQETITHNNKTESISFNGVMASYPEVVNITIENGRFFNQREEKSMARVVVLGNQIKKELFNEKNPVGETIKIGNKNFKVIGYLKEKGAGGFENLDTLIYIPVSTAQKLILGIQHVGAIRIKIDEDKYIAQTIEQIKKTLRIRHGIKDPADDDFSVVSTQSALETLTTITNVVRFVLAAVAAISLIVGGIGIMNIMLVVVNERTREIGLRKAIGAKPKDILRQFLTEAVFTTLLGGSVGILFGILITTIIALIVQSQGYKWDLIISLEAITAGITVSSLIGIIFGYYPAKKAAKLNSIEALRYE